MGTIDRRTFLRRSAMMAAGTVGLTAGPYTGLLARAAMAQPQIASNNGGYGPLGPVPDLRDGVERLLLPNGFQYRSFGLLGTPLTEEATLTPGRHDGMAAFPWGRWIRLVRNHEQTQPGVVGAFGDTSKAYDATAPGGTTTLQVSPQADRVLSWVSLNGTTFNCAGGATPWGSWLTCEETPNGPDSNKSFLVPPGGDPDLFYDEQHGFVFEVPVRVGPGQLQEGVPIRKAGRFAHEAAIVDPVTGVVYQTEDDFAYPSGFYRYTPPNDPFTDGRIADGGKLEVLGVIPDGATSPVTMDLSRDQTPGTIYDVGWIEIENPDPTFPTGITNDEAARVVFQEGESKGAAQFSRLEGISEFARRIFFVSTEGGGPFDSDPPPNSSAGFGEGYGQVWMYDVRAGTLTLIFESPGPDVLDFPDNITLSPRRKSVVLCEDSPSGNMLRALTREGHVFDFAANNISGGADEFAGATFAPDGQVLYVNMQSNGITYAIWGPFNRGML